MNRIESQSFFDGQIQLLTGLNEFRESLWVNGFALRNQLTDEEILPFISFFDIIGITQVGDVLNITFKIYPDGLKSYTIEVNPFMKTFRYKGKEYPVSCFEEMFAEKG